MDGPPVACDGVSHPDWLQPLATALISRFGGRATATAGRPERPGAHHLLELAVEGDPGGHVLATALTGESDGLVVALVLATTAEHPGQTPVWSWAAELLSTVELTGRTRRLGAGDVVERAADRPDYEATGYRGALLGPPRALAAPLASPVDVDGRPLELVCLYPLSRSELAAGRDALVTGLRESGVTEVTRLRRPDVV